MAERRSKTDTIKERAIYVYLSSPDMTQRWKKMAEKAGTSISKFVIEHVENSLGQEEGEYEPRIQLVKKINGLEEEVSELSKENKMLNIVIERLESELKQYRTKPFLEEQFTGIRKYDRNLVALFKRHEKVMSDEITAKLGIDPRDTELVKAINRQIENLERYGLLKAVPGGWKWIA